MTPRARTAWLALGGVGLVAVIAAICVVGALIGPIGVSLIK